MYIVLELQTNADGTVGTLVNNYTSRNDAEARYHTILAAAAVSSVPVHAAAMMSEEGFPLMNQAYRHNTPAAVDTYSESEALNE